MRIVFDATAMPTQRAGAGQYTYYLARALAAHAAEHPLLITMRSADLNDLATAPGVTLRHVTAAGRAHRFAWEQSTLPRVARGWGADVLHGPHHSLPLLPAARVAVTTVHDITFDLLPQRYTRTRRLYMRAITRLGVLRAQRVIVPSRFVRAALIRRYPVSPSRVAVVPEAALPHLHRVTDAATLARVRHTYDLPPRFVLSVGTREPGKNRAVLLRAVARLAQRGVRVPVVIVGQRGWGDDPEGLPDGLVRYTGYVPDADLAALYSLAVVFLFPSWLEGFGLPPLEAMACGTAVIAARRPAMTEVLGEATLYADPRDADAWADAIERLLTDDALRGQMVARGTAQAARYSWQRAARETLAVYADALADGEPISPHAVQP